MPNSLSLACTLLVASTSALATTYQLSKAYSGQNFFDGWEFADGVDNILNGAVNWLNQSAATSAGLASIDSDGRAIIKVDDNTRLPDTGLARRNSVAINTHDYFPLGSVFILDANHIPFGCSVWPAFWTRGENWPDGGEIDILETVNLMPTNQMALHTLQQGCTQPQDVEQLGRSVGSDCSAGAGTDYTGCAVAETQSNSVGENFANAGGGVWATQFDTSGIFIWFWSRKDVPSDVTSTAKSVDPSAWGTPSAAWPASSCNIPNLFTSQQLVLDVTLCGDFAGKADVYKATCGKVGVTVGSNTCYVENVNGTGANYADAFFDINYIKVYSLNTGSSTSDASSPTIGGGSDASTKASTLPAGAIAGVSVAGTLAALSVVGIIFWCWRRKQRRQRIVQVTPVAYTGGRGATMSTANISDVGRRSAGSPSERTVSGLQARGTAYGSESEDRIHFLESRLRDLENQVSSTRSPTVRSEPQASSTTDHSTEFRTPSEVRKHYQSDEHDVVGGRDDQPGEHVPIADEVEPNVADDITTVYSGAPPPYQA